MQRYVVFKLIPRNRGDFSLTYCDRIHDLRQSGLINQICVVIIKRSLSEIVGGNLPDAIGNRLSGETHKKSLALQMHSIAKPDYH